MGGVSARLGALLLLLLLGAGAAEGSSGPPIRAAYFYHYMGASHLDSLQAHGFGRAVIHWIPDSLDARGHAELAAFVTRGATLGVEVTPEWSWQSPSRLDSRPPERRYTWGRGRREADVPCPLDSLYWRSGLLDRADEFLGASPGLTSLAIDLELFRGSRHHLDAGPCRCPACLADYAAGRSGGRPSLAGLLGWEEARLARILGGLCAEFRTRHPGVELGALDLDFDSFAHRALARALARAAVPTMDYCERTYAGAAIANLSAARARLDALGLQGAPLLGGAWLKRLAPGDVAPALRAIDGAADGHFVFTTFSLWLDPAKLQGPYVLEGAQADYWSALAAANGAP